MNALGNVLLGDPILAFATIIAITLIVSALMVTGGKLLLYLIKMMFKTLHVKQSFDKF
jgi:hypothetical protein